MIATRRIVLAGWTVIRQITARCWPICRPSRRPASASGFAIASHFEHVEMPARILALCAETHVSGWQRSCGLQGSHARSLGPRACRVVSETSAFDGNSVWILSTTAPTGLDGSGPNPARRGIKSDGSRSNAGHLPRGIRDVSLRTSVSTGIAERADGYIDFEARAVRASVNSVLAVGL